MLIGQKQKKAHFLNQQTDLDDFWNIQRQGYVIKLKPKDIFDQSPCNFAQCAMWSVYLYQCHHIPTTLTL